MSYFCRRMLFLNWIAVCILVAFCIIYDLVQDYLTYLSFSFLIYEDNGDLLQKVPCTHCCTQLPLTLHQATADPCLCQRLLDSHRQVWVSLLWGHCSFLLGPGVHKVFFVSSKSLFPQFCGSFVINSQWPPKANSWGFSVPFPHPQFRKSAWALELS